MQIGVRILLRIKFPFPLKQKVHFRGRQQLCLSLNDPTICVCILFSRPYKTHLTRKARVYWQIPNPPAGEREGGVKASSCQQLLNFITWQRSSSRLSHVLLKYSKPPKNNWEHPSSPKYKQGWCLSVLFRCLENISVYFAAYVNRNLERR